MSRVVRPSRSYEFPNHQRSQYHLRTNHGVLENGYSQSPNLRRLLSEGIGLNRPKTYNSGKMEIAGSVPHGVLRSPIKQTAFSIDNSVLESVLKCQDSRLVTQYLHYAAGFLLKNLLDLKKLAMKMRVLLKALFE